MIKVHSLESFGARLRTRLLAIDASLLASFHAMPPKTAREPSAEIFPTQNLRSLINTGLQPGGEPAERESAVSTAFQPEPQTVEIETVSDHKSRPDTGLKTGVNESLYARCEMSRQAQGGKPGEDSFPEFNAWALELFSLQFTHNEAYRRFCKSRGVSSAAIRDWREIPAVPAAAFKELELSSIPEGQRTTVFFSSGTTEHRPSRHFHSQASLEIYEGSVIAWFARQLMGRIFPVSNGNSAAPMTDEPQPCLGQIVALTPGPGHVPHSSLVHMFETLRRRLSCSRFSFTGFTGNDAAWRLDSARTTELLQGAIDRQQPIMVLGTAFSYVHLLDYLAEGELNYQLPQRSLLLETGGYKGRSRALPKSELHELITHRLGIPPSHIICEYGMSELSSQAYDRAAPRPCNASQAASPQPRYFQFPPWSRVQIISPETGREVLEGETGLLRVLDLANVYSVMGVQTQDLAVRRGDGFELIGRATLAEARGCSLMAH